MAHILTAQPDLTNAARRAIKVLHAREQGRLPDADIAGATDDAAALFAGLSELVGLELVDYERAERAHFLNYDGFALVEGTRQREAAVVAEVRAARAAQPAYDYTIGTFKWLLLGLITVIGLATYLSAGGQQPTAARGDDGGLEYTALDSATWQVSRAELARPTDTTRRPHRPQAPASR